MLGSHSPDNNMQAQLKLKLFKMTSRIESVCTCVLKNSNSLSCSSTGFSGLELTVPRDALRAWPAAAGCPLVAPELCMAAN